jgi:acetoacetyl-CoA synthetase
MESPCYTPPNPESTRTDQFLRKVNAKHDLQLNSYEDLYIWSITRIADFWDMVWDETDVIGSKGDHVVDLPATPADNPAWFTNAKLNWAENMLRCRSAEKLALVQASMFVLSEVRDI